MVSQLSLLLFTIFTLSNGQKSDITWNKYQVAGMNILSAQNLTVDKNYDKVLIFLHGGGGSGIYEASLLDWYGDITGIKVVWPTSARSDHLWFRTYKNGCSEEQDCSYHLEDIKASGDWIAELIAYEQKLVGGDAKNVFLGGFSQGAEMTCYMQIAKIDFALGGAIVMDGYPIPPLVDMLGDTPREAKKNATYYGDDMRWMIWHGSEDIYFNANRYRIHSIYTIYSISFCLTSDDDIIILVVLVQCICIIPFGTRWEFGIRSSLNM